MALKQLYDPSTRGQMRVVGLMSGSGSNLRKILDFEQLLKQERGASPFTVVAIFSDNAESNVTKIGKDYDVPVVTRDIAAFYRARGKPKKDLSIRPAYDSLTVQALAPYGARVAAYAGYMSIATDPLLDKFLGVNVHPADLSIMEGERRKYTGDHAVRDAILAGERQLRSSTHLIEHRVDYGKVFMISVPLDVRLPADFDPQHNDLVKKVSDEHQNRLKEVGDWVIFPKTLLYLAEGRYAWDEEGHLYFDNEPIPCGVRL